MKITELEERITFLENMLVEKDELISKYQNNFLLNSFNFLTSVIDGYSIWLNPEKQKFNATHKGKSEDFEISVSNIIGIQSQGRLKECYLHKQERSLDDERRLTNLIYSNSNEINLDDLLHLYDKHKFFLLKIGRDKLINVKYYDLSNGVLTCNSKTKNLRVDLHSIKLKKQECEEFKNKKSFYNKIFSLQKLFVRYKAHFGIPI